MPHIKRHTGIYCFENKINGKKYIGQAHNIERRLYEHEYYLERGGDKCTTLQRAIDKYGRENFDVYILEICSDEELNDREVYWISHFKTNDRRYGYNISNGGNQSMLGYKFPPEVGRKISMAKKGTKLSEETKKKMSQAQKGKIVSEETRRKMSEAWSGVKHYMWGKTHSEESKRKMSASHSGENAYQLGKKSSESTSRYYGVYKMIQKGHTYWGAKVNHAGHRTYVGMSKDEIEAAKMYDSYVLEHNLPNPLNFPEEK